MATDRAEFLKTFPGELEDQIAEARAAAAQQLALLGRARLRGALRARDLRRQEGARDPSDRPDPVAVLAQRAAGARHAAERSRVPRVMPEAHQAVVHGRVIGPAGGAEGATVVVVNGRGQEVARTTSAAVGYFRFVFPPGKRPGPKGRAAKVDKSEGEDQPEAGEVAVRVEVRDGSSIVVAQDVTLARGKAIYVELAIR